MYTFKKGYPGYEGLAFVLRAKGGEGSREAYQAVKVERIKEEGLKSRVVTTDGRRIHIAKIKEELEPGLYEVTSQVGGEISLEKLENGLSYPDYAQAIPMEDGRKTVEVSLTNRESSTLFSKAVAKVIRALPETLSVDVDFLRDALCDDFVFFIPMKAEALLFRSPTKIAVIMPIGIRE